jgi:poly(3-hydroxybutyrate) depolymerase
LNYESRYGYLSGLLVSTLCACSTSPPQTANPDEPIRHTFTHDAVAREYFVYPPKDYAKGRTHWPLVSVHGGGKQTGRNPVAQDLRRFADESDLPAIIISPSFSNTDVQSSRFPALGEGAFLEAVLADARRRYALHPKILLTGYSRGGQFTHRFALANPDMVRAVATFAAGTWTTPQGTLLIEGQEEVSDVNAYLSDPSNMSAVPERLHGMFTPRVSAEAGRPAHANAAQVPFLVMCGTLDPRLPITQRFVERLREASFNVTTEWPRTPHGGRSTDQYRAEFMKYQRGAVAFFEAMARIKSP